MGDKPHLENADQDNLILERDVVLSASCILVWDGPIAKAEAMRQLLDASCREWGDCKAVAWEALLKREQQGGTFVGEDVALPHARITGLRQPLIALGICGEGIEDLQSGHVVKIMLLLLSPSDPPESHVAALGVVSRLARDDQWRKGVLAVRESSDVMKIIRRRESRRETASK